jgi:hypothetical protein
MVAEGSARILYRTNFCARGIVWGLSDTQGLESEVSIGGQRLSTMSVEAASTLSLMCCIFGSFDMQNLD